jgi:hypothetical protein
MREEVWKTLKLFYSVKGRKIATLGVLWETAKAERRSFAPLRPAGFAEISQAQSSNSAPQII